VDRRAVPKAVWQATAENGAPALPSQAAFSIAIASANMRDDASADRSAQLLGADAVTFGNQVLFRSGRYAPNTRPGRELIAHELVHVAYQSQTGRRYPQRSVAGDVLSVQFTQAMAEAMTNDELDQQSQLLRAHLQVVPGDVGAAENLHVLETVLQVRQGTARESTPPATPAPPGAAQPASGPPTEAPQAAQPQHTPGGAEQHGKIWSWLHSHGLVQTKHENADILRKGWGAQSGVIVTDKDGNPVDVERLSDDEVIALDKQLRGVPRPRIEAALPPPVMWPLACDVTGKVHGRLPNAADAQQKIQNMGREDLEQSAEELKKSIAARKAEQLRLGEEGPHRARIAQEEDLLRAIEKKLSGS
jgi:hypothetical protein